MVISFFQALRGAAAVAPEDEFVGQCRSAQPSTILPPRQLLEIDQNPAAALNSSLFPRKTLWLSDVLQFQRADASPTNSTLLVSCGRGIV